MYIISWTSGSLPPPLTSERVPSGRLVIVSLPTPSPQSPSSLTDPFPYLRTLSIEGQHPLPHPPIFTSTQPHTPSVYLHLTPSSPRTHHQFWEFPLRLTTRRPDSRFDPRVSPDTSSSKQTTVSDLSYSTPYTPRFLPRSPLTLN